MIGGREEKEKKECPESLKTMAVVTQDEADLKVQSGGIFILHN
jgi:hypothetical protein